MSEDCGVWHWQARLSLLSWVVLQHCVLGDVAVGATKPPPDISGYWNLNLQSLKSAETNNRPPLNEAYAAILHKREAALAAGKAYADPTALCKWNGMPRVLMEPFPMQIVRAQGEFLMLQQQVSEFRHIYTDGRPHPKDPDPTFEGHSIAHWDAGSLIVDTVGFNDSTWLDFVGAPHSDAMHIVERIRLLTPDTLEDEFTVTDPSAFTAAWRVALQFKRLTGYEWTEVVCTENNRVRVDANGIFIDEK